jgi:hypothetical protein
MTKWMSGAVVVLAMMSVSWMQGRPAASAGSHSVESSSDPLASEAAARHRQCLPNHWRSFALQPRF